jgi:hypothetical protein
MMVDIFAIEKFYMENVDFKRIENCRHLILLETAAACEAIITDLLAKHCVAS